MQTSATEHRSHQSLPEILQELQTDNTELCREALEALVFYFMQQLGLEFKTWRVSGDMLEKVAVKAIAEGTHLAFSRWQIQCTNGRDYKVSEDDIAIEVGLSILLKSNVICIVTTGLFSRKALSYADAVISKTNLNIITIDREDLRVLTASPQALVDILNKKARQAMELRKLTVNQGI